MPALTARLSVEEQAILFLARTPRRFDGCSDALAAVLPRCDPNDLVRLATDHAVYPLVAYNLKRSGLPFDTFVASELQNLFMASHRNGLLLAHSLAELLSLLKEAGIEAVTYKGPAFAVTNYGDLRWRVYGDLDLFVAVPDARRTRDLLLDLGFDQIDPLPAQPTGRFKSYWPFGHPHGNAVGFVRAAGSGRQVDVDLQWGLAPNFLKVGIDPPALMRRRRTTALFGHDVSTFDPTDTLLLMCLHGAKHAWTELRQVVDVATCLEDESGIDWEVALERITEANLVRICALAFRLAEVLLGISVPDRYRERLLNDSEAEAMESLVSLVVSWRFASGHDEGGVAPRRRMRAIRYHLASRDRFYHGFGAVVYHVRGALRGRHD